MSALGRILAIPRMLRLTARALRYLVAVGVAVLILAPAEVWDEPENDFIQRGFDATLMPEGTTTTSLGAARFAALVPGEWTACPCEPGTELALVGRDLVPFSLSDSNGPRELGGVVVTVDNLPARIYAVSPTQVNIGLDAEAAPPGAAIAITRDGTVTAREFIAIRDPGRSTQTADRPERATITSDELRLAPAPGASSVVHLLTTPRSVRASFDVTLEAAGDVRPLEVLFWNPRTEAAIGLVFETDPAQVFALAINEEGAVVDRRLLGDYAFGQAQTVELAYLDGKAIEVAYLAGTPYEVRETFHERQQPALFDAYRPTLSVISMSGREQVDASLTNFTLEMPHERFFSVRIDDRRPLALAIVLLIAAAILHAPLLFSWARSLVTLARRLPRDVWRAPGWLPPAALAATVVVIVIAPLGSHPFDMASQEAWTHILSTQGIGDIYYRAQIVPLATIWRGVPYHEAVYPYGVSMSYYFGSIGAGLQAFGGATTPGTEGLTVAIKAANTVVALADAFLVYLLVRGYGRERLAWLAPLAFLFNPAMFFDLFVWGETESVALFFLLASLLAAQRGAPVAAWALLALSFTGKQTVVIPAMVVGVYYLRALPLQRTLDGVSLAMPVVLLTVLPFLISGYSPSIAIDPILAAFNVFGGNETEEVFRVVSYDSFSIWPLVTLFRHDAHGLERLQFPDYERAIGSLSYQQAGLTAFAIVFLAVCAWLLFTRRTPRTHSLIFATLMLVTIAELILPTRSISRYLVFAVSFGIVAIAAEPRSKPLWFAAAAVCATSLVGMYGSVGSGLESNPALSPALAPEHNAMTEFALRMFRSDFVITTGSLLNICALLSVGWHVWLKGTRLPAVELPHVNTPLPAAQTGRAS
jgi:hypothetical protein